ncbi:MAG: hypothetical protein KatS3mg012_0349 [Gaiellaceae bacterium]|nr:MAG: hypothetical protein KatS3mg012_0349 [Gaiellaceae bacterium]
MGLIAANALDENWAFDSAGAYWSQPHDGRA